MKKKGFTLIELLAVIVVLAIIALIATPIVMNAIEKSKKGAAERTADSYVRAVETDIATSYVVDGFYGEVTTTIPVEALNEFIEIKGDKPTKGWVGVEQGVVVDYKLKIGDYTVIYDKDKKTSVATKESSLPSTVYRRSTSLIKIGDIIPIEDEFAPVPPVSITEEYTTDPSIIGRKTYLKHVLDKDGKVTESYACVRTEDEESCFTTGDYGWAENESDYTGYMLFLKGLKDKGYGCDFADIRSICDGDDFRFYASKDGGFGVYEVNIVSSGRLSGCSVGSLGSNCTDF